MSDATDAILRDFAGGSVPPGIALMRLILATSSPSELKDVLNSASQQAGRDERHGTAELDELLQASPDAWDTVHATAATVSHHAEQIPAQAMVQRLAQSFDAAARTSPEASVALYSLGDASQLEQATGEIAAWLRSQGLLGPERHVLDLGCGIGRLEQAIGGEVKRMVGIDISPEMIRIARERLAGAGNVEFRVTSGLDLEEHPESSFDAVFAVDTFPYLVQAGGSLAARHIEQSARVLRRGGDLAILNYSYRGLPEHDLGDLRAAATNAGLDLVIAGERPFRTWDATVFRLRKPDRRSPETTIRPR